MNTHPKTKKTHTDSAVKRPSESSHNRLFGDVERVPPTPKSYHKTSIPIGVADDTTDAPKMTNGNGHAIMNGNGNGHAAAATTSNGNGVAHENGHAKTNGTNGHMNGGSRGNYAFPLFFLLKCKQIEQLNLNFHKKKLVGTRI